MGRRAGTGRRKGRSRLPASETSLAKGDFDAAIARLDEAVRLEPKQAKYRGLRGVAWLRKGDYAKGAADLKAAIALNPGDAGLHYQPSNGSRLSAEALAHGQEQVAKMLHDRPAMAEFGDEAKFLRDWAARKFAGEDFVEPIDWDPSPPLHSDAEHLAPGDGENAAILVEAHYTSGPKEGKPRSFEELWAGAVYELHNVNYAREFVRLNDEADRGRVSKEAFVAGILKYELQAAQRTRAFYLQRLSALGREEEAADRPDALVLRLVGHAGERAEEFFRQVGVSLAAVRPRARLGHGPPLLAPRPVRQGPRTLGADAGRRGLRRGAGRRFLLARALPDPA